MRRWFTKLLGDRGENAAVQYLRKAGYQILIRNHKNQFGEIDIIARDGDTIVFVEVKTRSEHTEGRPEEAVTRTKQRQITRAASVWLQQHKLHQHRCRFDVIAIVWRTGEQPIIDHIQSAFEATN